MCDLLKNLILSFTILFASIQTAFAMPEILPLEKVQSGMSGKAYTIVDNSGFIEPFDVNIVGLMDSGKGSAKMIMAQASGSLIEKTGGILQGMSGSPVYVDGKLIGAVAIGLKDMSPYTFFITPIEDMLKLWNLPDTKYTAKYSQPTTEEKTSEGDEISEEEKLIGEEEISDTVIPAEEIPSKKKSKRKKKSKSNKVEQSPAEETKEKNSDAENSVGEFDSEKIEEKTSFYFSGFNAEGESFLKREFENLGLRNLYSAPISGKDQIVNYNAKLEPGSAVGVAVVYGDFSVGATGTVTAVDGKRILGFGHPFTHAGNVNFFMTDASVIGSVSGGDQHSGVKVASIGNIIGRINQDREAGIAGILGKFPSVVPITVNIKDNYLNRSETYNASIAYNETLIPKLGAAIAYTSLSKTADSLAESTVTVDFDIKTNVVDDGNFTRQNMFYNVSDVGQVAVMELMQALTIVCSNTTEESDIFGINVNIELDNERKTASLVSAVPDKVKVKPGETVNLTVTLQPYRKPTEKVVVPYTVPLAAKEGPLTLDLHGGALVPVAQVLANVGIIMPTNETPAQNYDEKIKNFLKTGKNNQIVVEPGASAEIKSDKELKKDIERAKKAQARLEKLGKKTDSSPNENKVDTGYIIDNVIHAIINVDKI